MKLKNRINAFVKLGDFLNQFSENNIVKKDSVECNDPFFEAISLQIKNSHETNGWFTEKNIIYALRNWSKVLNKNDLNNWTSTYALNKQKSKNVVIITAGNIPLVGFHDFLSVLLSGNNTIIKQSSNDKYFLPLIAKYLECVEPEFRGKIFFTEKKLENFDAVIATGSNNTARYFDYYFGKYPSIIRKNKNSVAVINGKESALELEQLGEDIFRYFGLGCRSVSKIYVPRDYNFDLLFNAFFKFKGVIEYKKYENNYDYNKAVYLMSQFKIIENGFLMLKEDTSYSSPIASLFYEYYDHLDELMTALQNDTEYIQCIVGNADLKDTVNFGDTQRPQLNDYADGIDTLTFLQNL